MEINFLIHGLVHCLENLDKYWSNVPLCDQINLECQLFNPEKVVPKYLIVDKGSNHILNI